MAGGLLLGCDNQGALYQVKHIHWYVLSTTKYAELICTIHALCQCCPITITFQCVAGHQDDLTWWDDLPVWACLNVQANAMATFPWS